MHTQLCSFCCVSHSFLSFSVGAVVDGRKEWAGGFVAVIEENGSFFPTDSSSPN